MYFRAICNLRTGQSKLEWYMTLCFGPYTILAWTVQSVNLHIALKAMYCLLSRACKYVSILRSSACKYVSILRSSACKYVSILRSSASMFLFSGVVNQNYMYYQEPG